MTTGFKTLQAPRKFPWVGGRRESADRPYGPRTVLLRAGSPEHAAAACARVPRFDDAAAEGVSSASVASL